MRSRTFQWSDSAEAARTIETVSGPDYLRSLKDQMIDEPPIGRPIDPALPEVEMLAIFPFGSEQAANNGLLRNEV